MANSSQFTRPIRIASSCRMRSRTVALKSALYPDKILEDAVDVADSYSSITNKKLQQSMLQNVGINQAAAIANNNTNGKIIYGLLKTIFLSADDSNKIDLTKELGIPPIFDVANKYMRDDKAGIVEQVFFYGDKDGKTFYPPFRNSFSPAEWKVTDKKEWRNRIGNIKILKNGF